VSSGAGKKIVICSDGTWNPVEKLADGSFISTNVSKLAGALARIDAQGRPQVLGYFEGVGTHPEEKVGGGAFGAGLSANLSRAYAFLVDTYEPGDTIHLFGFSRGAYTVRSLAGMIANSGILRRDAKATVDDAFALYRDRSTMTSTDSIKARVFRQMHAQEAEIEFVGVWDTVGALGIPLMRYGLAQWLGYSWKFHSVTLGSHIRHACHALAIHEKRSQFVPTLWSKETARTNQTLEQVWFSGAHADVGGGYKETGLSDITLDWMIQQASLPNKGGLVFRPGWQADYGCSPDPEAQLHSEFKGFFKMLGGTERKFRDPVDPTFETCESLHPTVLDRRKLAQASDFWPDSFK
jgi:uncharacterized protein (DUF2235 family)